MVETSPADGPKAILQRVIDEAALATGAAAQAHLPAFRARLDRHAHGLALARHPLSRAFHRWRLRRLRRLVAEALEDLETARIVAAATREAARRPG